MAHDSKGDFCAGESPAHCGCMRLSTCTALAVTLVKSYGKALPGGIREYNDAYQQNGSPANGAALCKAVWEHTNPELRAFMQAYQQYISKSDVHELLDELGAIDDDDAATDDAGEGDAPQKGEITIVFTRA